MLEPLMNAEGPCVVTQARAWCVEPRRHRSDGCSPLRHVLRRRDQNRASRMTPDAEVSARIPSIVESALSEPGGQRLALGDPGQIASVVCREDIGEHAEVRADRLGIAPVRCCGKN